MNIVKGMCCWGTDYCKCEFLKLARNQNIKLGYILFVVLTISIITLASIFVEPSQSVIETLNCNTNSTEAEKQHQCVKEQLLFRWMLGLVVMHFAIAIVVLLRSQLSKIVNQGAWMLKICLLLALGFLFVYVFNGTFLYVLQVSAGYLVPVWYFFQTLIVVDLIYSIDNSFRQAAENSPKFQVVKALLSLICIIGAVVLNVLSYVHHSESSGTRYISILSSVYLGVFLIACITRVAKSNTLLVFGMVMLYSNMIAYYLHCPVSEPNHTFYIIQFVLVIFSLFGILTSGSNKFRTKKSSVNEILALNTSKEEEDNRYVSSNKWIIFHLVFLLMSLALPFVINQSGESFYYSEKGQNQWGNIFAVSRVIGWFFIVVVYLWTIVAARIYPDQDFDELQNYFKEFQLN